MLTVRVITIRSTMVFGSHGVLFVAQLLKTLGGFGHLSKGRGCKPRGEIDLLGSGFLQVLLTKILSDGGTLPTFQGGLSGTLGFP